MSIVIGEAKPYGYFGSLKALEEAIQKRQVVGESLTGDAVVFQGAEIINKDNSIRIKDQNRDYPRFDVRVSPEGISTASFTPEHEFNGEPPMGWKEVENP